jgi:hypothetical protein
MHRVDAAPGVPPAAAVTAGWPGQSLGAPEVLAKAKVQRAGAATVSAARG